MEVEGQDEPARTTSDMAWRLWCVRARSSDKRGSQGKWGEPSIFYKRKGGRPTNESQRSSDWGILIKMTHFWGAIRRATTSDAEGVEGRSFSHQINIAQCASFPGPSSSPRSSSALRLCPSSPPPRLCPSSPPPSKDVRVISRASAAKLCPLGFS